MVKPVNSERSKVVIYVYVPEELKQRLRRYSFETNISMNNVVESALEHYFAVMNVKEEVNERSSSS